jgi:hypothetical protein
MAIQPEPIQTEDLVPRFEERFEEELARGTSRGRAALVAFLDVGTTELADWSPTEDGDDLLQVEIDSDETRVFVGLMRNMAHRTRGGGVNYTNFNLQMAFARPKDNPAEYAWVQLGGEGLETPAKLLDWLSSHPTVGPVIDSTPPEMDVYMD